MREIATSEEYAKHSWKCPVCDSDEIEGSEVEINGEGASQNVRCNKCFSKWIDVHVLAGYENLEIIGEEK